VELRWPCSPEKCRQPEELVVPYLDVFSVHEPWDPPRWYVERYDPGYDRAGYMAEAELRHTRALYAGTMLDKWLGWLFEKLDDLGIWEETAVIFTSDHGFYLGEHGLVGKHTVLEPEKGWPLYGEVAHIPLMVKVPGTEGGEEGSDREVALGILGASEEDRYA